MEGRQGLRRYMAGDAVRIELMLEHRMNLSRVFVAFSHVTDPLTEFYFEATAFLGDGSLAGDVRRSRAELTTMVPPETVPGVYVLNRINAFSVSGKLARLRSQEHLSAVSEKSFEIVEEPLEAPTVVDLVFRD